jgi:hypothetical protein
MPTGDKVNFLGIVHLYLKIHVASDVLVSRWHLLIIVQELKGDPIVFPLLMALAQELVLVSWLMSNASLTNVGI